MTQLAEPIAKALTHNDAIGGSLWVEYSGLKVLAPVRDVREAVAILKARGPDRYGMIAAMNHSLKRRLDLVRGNKASQKQAERFVMDVAIWYANEIVEGRATVTNQSAV